MQRVGNRNEIKTFVKINRFTKNVLPPTRLLSVSCFLVLQDKLTIHLI